MGDERTPEDVSVHALTLAGVELRVLVVPLPDEAKLGVLSRAEREVVVHVLQGCSSAQIAELRGTSVRTVANQLASVFEKLEVSGRSELASRLAGPRE